MLKHNAKQTIKFLVIPKKHKKLEIYLNSTLLNHFIKLNLIQSGDF